jgi:two-component system, sensor histidine kinase and response regulator
VLIAPAAPIAPASSVAAAPIRKRSWMMEAPWLFLVALLIATGVATYQSHRQTEAAKKLRFELIAKDSKVAFSKALRESDELLLSANALIAAIPTGDQRLWNYFFNARADGTAETPEPPGLVRVDYVPSNSAKDTTVSAVQARIPAAGKAAPPSLAIATPAAQTPQPQRFTRIYTSPTDAPAPTLLLDKVPAIAAAIAESAKTQKLAVSRPVSFAQERQAAPTMVSFVWPVHPVAADGKKSLLRETVPIGFLIGLIKLDEVVAAVNKREGERIKLSLVRDGVGAPSGEASPAVAGRSTPDLTMDLPFELGSHQWILRADATEQLERELKDITPRIILVIGLLGTALLAGLVWLLTRLREQAETLALNITTKLRDQMKFSEDLIEFNPNPIFRKDAKGRFVSVNRAWEQLSGRSRKDVLGKSNQEFQRPEVARLNELADQRLYESPSGFEANEVFITNAEGRKFETIIAKQVIRKADGTTDGLIGTITDVSTIKRLEREIALQREQLDLVISASQQGIWDVELRTDGLEYFSTTFREILGYSAGGFPQRFIWQDNIHPEDVAVFAHKMLQHFKNEAPYFDAEARARRRDGTYIWVRARGLGRRDSSGKVVRFVGSIVDITDRKEAETMLIEGSARITEAARAKEAFLATMSHEIRTPLNGVLGMATLLAESPLNEEQRDYIRLIRASGDTLLRLINDVLDFSKIESGHMTLEAVPVEIFPLVEDVFELVAEKAREKRLVMTFDMRDDVPFYILGDATRIRQILLNLLSNAIKFTERGSIAVTFAAHRNRAGKLELEGRVQDSGIGIPSDQLAKLFQPFTQADASTTRKYGGTGLGLAIIKRLTQMMGGEVRVESVEGEGTTFIFTIETQAARGPLRPYMQRDVFDFLGKRLLVVDSVPARHAMVKYRYSRWGFDTTVVAAEDAATTLMNAAPFDILIHDCAFPSTEARQLQAAIERCDFDRAANRESQLPVILISAATRTELQSMVRDMPVRHDYFLLRPTALSKTFDALMRAVLGETNIDPSTRPVVISAAADVTSAIAVSSSPVTGVAQGSMDSTFTRLRAMQSTETRPAAASLQSAPTPQVWQPSANALHLLVAEDNEVNQRVIGGMLKNLGHHVTIVDNGRAAVIAAAGGSFDVILMDIQMPELDGVSAMREIQANATDTAPPPIIAMTAHALAGDREHYLAEGMDDYLSKPIRLAEISLLLERIAPKIANRRAVLNIPVTGTAIPAATVPAAAPAVTTQAIIEASAKNRSSVQAGIATPINPPTTIPMQTVKAPVSKPPKAKPAAVPASPVTTRTPASRIEAMPLLDLEQLEDLRYLPASSGGANAADDPVGGLIRLFQSKAQERMELMENCLADSQWKTLMDVAHSLRGASASMGFPRVAALCKDLELAAKRRSEAASDVSDATDLPSQEELDETFELIKHHYSEADVALGEWIAQSAPAGKPA